MRRSPRSRVGGGLCVTVRQLHINRYFGVSVGESVVVGEYGVREVVMFLLKSLGDRVYSCLLYTSDAADE